MADHWLLKLDKKSLDCVKLIGEEAAKFDYRSYLVGGIVRDLILGRLNTDLDIVIEGNALVLAQRLAEVLKMDIVCHAEFRTAKLFDGKARHIDLTSSRREMYPNPGALPIVDEGNLQADLFRRDFTINALAVSLHPATFGQLVDMYGGLDDLKNGKIKIFHANSFNDDPTRILRAVRFEQRFGFQIEEQTAERLNRAVKDKAHKTLTDPRYFAEFRKILLEDDPIKPLQRLKKLGLLCLAGEALKLDSRSVEQSRQNLKKLARKSYFNRTQNPWIYYFIELLSACPEPKIKRICKKIQVSRELETLLLQAREVRQVLRKLDAKKLRKSGAYFMLKGYDIRAVQYFCVKNTKANVGHILELYLGHWQKVSLRIDGEDLKKLGVASGERLGKILRAVLARKIDGNIKTRGQEIKAAKELLAAI